MSRRLLAALLCVPLAAPGGTGPRPRVPVGAKLGAFRLKDTSDNPRSPADFRDSKAVVLAFLGIDCPLNTAYMPRLVELARQYQPKGVAFLGINSNRHDSLAEVTEHARKFRVPFPVCKDFGNKVADLAGAERTPEVVVLDAAGVIRYRGRIDDQYGYLPGGQSFQRPAPTRRDLAEALEEILAGKPVSVPETKSDGCLIARERPVTDAEAVTYTRDVAPIIQKRCLECHREGQIAPFALTDYDEVQGWGAMIREVVRERRMPPWHADPSVGRFANDRSLSAGEIDTIVRWVDNGMPRGAGEPPPPPKFAEGWTLGEPDLVFRMEKEEHVPATGTIDYRWVTIDPKLKEDVWVRGVEVRPGNRSVVHHILMFVLPPGQRRVDDVQEAGYFAAYAPGVNPRWFPEGHGKRIPAGGRIVFQLHYTANGAATTDRSSVGLYLAEGSNLKEVHTLGIANPRLFLPAGKPDVVVTQKHRLTQDVLLTALMPHTHLRGTSFRYDVTYPDGRREALLNVPRYDFNWQTGYELAEPKRLPEGSVILCTATYDNSENNPNNPDPTVDVRWGKQTWDEMMIGYFDYIPLGGKPEPPGGADGRQRRSEALRKFFEGLDKDKDGTISPDEVPALYRRGFERMLQRYDANDDGSLSRDEVPGLEGE